MATLNLSLNHSLPLPPTNSNKPTPLPPPTRILVSSSPGQTHNRHLPGPSPAPESHRRASVTQGLDDIAPSLPATPCLSCYLCETVCEGEEGRGEGGRCDGEEERVEGVMVRRGWKV